MKNEKTSKKVATIAGRVLKGLTAWQKDFDHPEAFNVFGTKYGVKVTIADLKALAASCLTQSADKPKARRK